MFVWDMIVDNILEQFLDMIYGQVIAFFGEFLAMIKVKTMQEQINRNGSVGPIGPTAPPGLAAYIGCFLCHKIRV